MACCSLMVAVAHAHNEESLYPPAEKCRQSHDKRKANDQPWRAAGAAIATIADAAIGAVHHQVARTQPIQPADASCSSDGAADADSR